MRTMIDDPAWRTLVDVLIAASAPGGPLDGWLFHGTDGVTADKIISEGVTTTAVLRRDADSQWWTDGTHWATANVAAFYAEDQIERYGDPMLPLAIIAARLDDLHAAGPLVADEQSLDAPILSRLGPSDGGRPSMDDVANLYDRRLALGDAEWAASLAATGSLVVLAPVGPDVLAAIRSPEDVTMLISRSDVDQRNSLSL